MKRWLAAAAAGLVALGGMVATRVPAQASSTAWRQVYQAAGVNGSFSRTAAINRNNIWSVGRTFTAKGATNFQPFVRHFDGRSWRAVAIPGSAGTTSDWVAASAANNVWIGGQQKATTSGSVVFRWDGARWSKIRVPGTTYVGGIAVLAPNNVWAFGSPGAGYDIFHWNGKTWQNYLPSSTNFIPQSISASAPNNVWVSGFAWSGSKRVVTAYRWDGRVWRRVGLPNSVLQSGPWVTAVSASDVWLGWGDGTANRAVHWDGRRWRPISLSYYANTIDIVPTGKGGYWFGAMAILNGTTWTDVHVPGFTGGFGGVTRIPGTTSFLINAGVVDPSGVSRPTIFQFDL